MLGGGWKVPMACAVAALTFPGVAHPLAADAGKTQGTLDYTDTIDGRNWASVGAEPVPPLWEMVANTYGQAETKTIRKSLDDLLARCPITSTGTTPN